MTTSSSREIRHFARYAVVMVMHPSRTGHRAEVKEELLYKVLCHSICVVIQGMYEVGIEPDFGAGG